MLKYLLLLVPTLTKQFLHFFSVHVNCAWFVWSVTFLSCETLFATFELLCTVACYIVHCTVLKTCLQMKHGLCFNDESGLQIHQWVRSRNSPH